VSGAQPASDDKQAESEIGAILDRITPLFGVLAGVMSALTTLSGDFSAVVRNHPQFIVLAAGSLLLGFAVTVWAFIKTRPGARRRKDALVFALFLFGVAFIVSFGATVATLSERQAPSITLAWSDENDNLEVTIRAENLPALARYRVAVNGVSPGERLDGRALFESVFSPNSDGLLEASIHVHIEPGRYQAVSATAWNLGARPSCTEESQSRRPTASFVGPELLFACSQIKLPGGYGPVIDMSMNRDGGGLFVTGSVHGELPATKRLVVVITASSTGEILYSTEVQANQEGLSTTSIRVFVPEGVAKVCVTAAPVEQHHRQLQVSTSCPAVTTRGATPVWVELSAAGL
jgi:hypothetical protein